MGFETNYLGGYCYFGTNNRFFALKIKIEIGF